MSSFGNFWLPSMHKSCCSARLLTDSSIAWLFTSNTLFTKLDYFINKEERQWKCNTIFIIAVWPIIIFINAITKFFSSDLTSLHQCDIQRNCHEILYWAAPLISFYFNHQCLLLRLVVRRIAFFHLENWRTGLIRYCYFCFCFHDTCLLVLLLRHSVFQYNNRLLQRQKANDLELHCIFSRKKCPNLSPSCSKTLNKWCRSIIY